MLALMVSWQKHHGVAGAGQCQRMAAMSAAQIDRLLCAYRSPERRRRIASSGMAAMQREVAVRTRPRAHAPPARKTSCLHFQN